MRLAITAFIAGGSLLLFLLRLPEYWVYACISVGALCLLTILFSARGSLSKKCAVIALLFAAGLAWNARYVENRLENVLAIELEGKELMLEGVRPRLHGLRPRLIRWAIRYSIHPNMCA